MHKIASQNTKSLKHRIEHKIVYNNENLQCEICGEEEFSPNIEAWEISGKLVCDECAEEIFEDNGQFGVGA